MKKTIQMLPTKHAYLILASCLLLLATACTKPELNDDVVAGDPPPIGSYANSADIQPSELLVHLPFDGNATDTKGTLANPAPTGNLSYITGRKGQAYKGADGAFVGYNSGAVANLTSFTVSFWINTQKHTDGAEGLFALGRADGSFWGNFFVIIEGNGSSANTMQLKLHFQKNTTPPVSNSEHWIDPSARPDNMYGAWRHIAYTYDQTTSKAAYYANGNPINLGADADRKADATTALGALAFRNASRFIIGGFQNHLGAPFNSLEPWMKNYRGGLDEFRIYKKALTGAEVSALFQLERQAR